MPTDHEQTDSSPQPMSQAAPPEPGLADRLRTATRDLHTRAERTGVVHELLTGTIEIDGYTLLLRNLLPAYRAMEAGLDGHRARHGPAGAGRLAMQAVYRADALEADLESIYGGAWNELPVVAPAKRYAARIEDGGDDDGGRLIAHAYTRYLGDLNGGQVIGRLLANRLGLEQSQLNFYTFGQAADVRALRTRYRQEVDAAGRDVGPHEPVVQEAQWAFQANIDLSTSVQDIVRDQ